MQSFKEQNEEKKRNRSEINRANGLKGGRKAGALSLVRKMELKQKEIMDRMIYKKTAPLIRAGMLSAMGQNFVYRIDEERDSKGKLLNRKHVLVMDSDEIAQALDQIEEGGQHPDDKYYYVTTKEPDVRAIEMLLNRAYGKPKESLKVEGEVQFSLKALAEHRKSLEVEATVVRDSSEIFLPNETKKDES